MKWIVLPLCLFLASCTSKAPEIIQLPSDALLSDCIISPPPTLSGNTEKDKLLLASSWSLQTNNLGKCNQKIKTLQVWKINTMKRIGG